MNAGGDYAHIGPVLALIDRLSVGAPVVVVERAARSALDALGDVTDGSDPVATAHRRIVAASIARLGGVGAPPCPRTSLASTPTDRWDHRVWALTTDVWCHVLGGAPDLAMADGALRAVDIGRAQGERALRVELPWSSMIDAGWGLVVAYDLLSVAASLARDGGDDAFLDGVLTTCRQAGLRRWEVLAWLLREACVRTMTASQHIGAEDSAA